jgi:predicted PurR-regulated permease PerM
MTQVFKNPWFRLLLAAAAVYLLFRLLWGLRDPLTPFAVAMALAYFLNPLVNRLERTIRLRAPWLARRVEPRTAAVAVITLATVFVCAGGLLLVIPALYHQVSDAIANVPRWFQQARARIEPLIQRLNLRYPEQSEQIRDQLQSSLRDIVPAVASPVTRVLRTAFSSVLGFVLTLINLVIIPVFAVYLMFDMNRIRAGAADLVPLRHRPYLYARLDQVDSLLSAFARGQITVCLMLGVFYAIGLTFCGVPMGLLVGFVIGLFNMIPFMSAVLGLPLGLILSWVDDQSLSRLLAVAGVFAFGQFVEGNFITPRIVGQSIGLHAVIIMLAVLVGGSAFGFAGMVLAVPVTAALSVFWPDLKAMYTRSRFFTGDEPADAAPPPNP